MRYLSLSLLFLLSVCSCSKDRPTLEWALRCAGPNRGEMEKVLAHYSRKSEDSLKLRAAEFLIKNMPGHYSLDPAIVNAFCDQVDSILATPLDTSLLELAKTNLKEADDQDWAGFKVKAMEAVSKRFPVKPSSSQSDIRILKADYLIRNIENAFETGPLILRLTIFANIFFLTKPRRLFRRITGKTNAVNWPIGCTT